MYSGGCFELGLWLPEATKTATVKQAIDKVT